MNLLDYLNKSYFDLNIMENCNLKYKNLNNIIFNSNLRNIEIFYNEVYNEIEIFYLDSINKKILVFYQNIIHINTNFGINMSIFDLKGQAVISDKYNNYIFGYIKDNFSSLVSETEKYRLKFLFERKN